MTDEGVVGAQAWLNAYHGLKSEHILSGPLRYHAGIIQAAIAVEWGDKEVRLDQI